RVIADRHLLHLGCFSSARTMSHCKDAVIVFFSLLVAGWASAQTLDDACSLAGASLSQVCASSSARGRTNYAAQPDVSASLRGVQATQVCRAPRKEAARDSQSWSLLGLPEPRSWMVWLFGIAAAAVIALRRGRDAGFWE